MNKSRLSSIAGDHNNRASSAARFLVSAGLAAVLGVLAYVSYHYTVAVRGASINRTLIEAAGRADTDRVLSSLQSGAEVDAAYAERDDSSGLRRVYHALRGSVHGSQEVTALGNYLSIMRDESTRHRPEQPQLVEALLDRGADPNCDVPEGTTPLGGAVFWDYRRTARLLIQHGARVNDRDSDGCTPLYRAVQHDNIPMATLLIEAQADPGIPDDDGVTPLHIAKLNRDGAMVKLLRQSAEAHAGG